MPNNKIFSCVNSYELNSIVEKDMLNNNGHDFALVSLDINNFNYINDLYGYEKGDMILAQCEKRFAGSLANGEFFCRLYNDHFLFWIKNTKNLYERLIKLTDFKQFVEENLSKHYKLVFSGGIFVPKDNNVHLNAFVDKVNFAHKLSKGNHFTRFVTYDDKLDKELEWKKIVTLDMEAALEQGHFVMYLQPKILLKTQEVIGAEALVRWNHSKFGLIVPDKFIPIMEQNGFIKYLDFFMLKQACIYIVKRKKNNQALFPISVNFSKAHIENENFSEELLDIVEFYGVQPQYIEVELTETVFADNFELLIKFATRLKDNGFKVSLDDFGRAYSSLNYLMDMPLDYIKIDKTFLKNISNNGRGKIVVEKMVELIRSLNLSSVIEGVETKEHEDFVRSLSCDYVQGFYYSRPLPIDKFNKYISQSNFVATQDGDNGLSETEDTLSQNLENLENYLISGSNYGALNSISDIKSEVSSLLIRATLDPLTKILNKEEITNKVTEHLKTSTELSAFIIVDIDNFKSINDNLGHQFGDSVLINFTSTICKVFNENAIVGRLGGDEIAILLTNCESIDKVKQKAAELNVAVKNCYYGESAKYHLTASIGITFAPTQGTTFTRLYKNADTALYESKHGGKDCFRVYEKSFSSKEVYRTPLEYNERFLNTYFSGDPVYNVFEMLYEAKHLPSTMQMILEKLGCKYNVDRAYIFEHDKSLTTINNTYEWCAEGIRPEKETLQNLEADNFSEFFNTFNKEGICVCNDIRKLEEKFYQFFKAQNVTSFLLCGLYDNGKLSGLVGFDDCSVKRNWKGEEIAVVGYLSRILSVFLFKSRAYREVTQLNESYVEMLGSLGGYVYVIDRKTFKLIYVNKPMQQFNAALGDECYKMAFGFDSPCENCPVKKLNNNCKQASSEIYSELISKWVNSSATQLSWCDGTSAALVCCTEIDKKV